MRDREQAIQVTRNSGCRSLRVAVAVVDAIEALPVVVTDEMVERALYAFRTEQAAVISSADRMRAALEAALREEA